MTPDIPPPVPTPGSRALRLQVSRVRRRALAVALGGAVIAALAADVWYEVSSFWIFRLFKVRIWNPLFFFVALGVFVAFVARRTGTLALSRLLDARFALKERLASAFRFARSEAVPAEVREAQARETLRAVDFDRLRSWFRFRPWGPLALLASGAVVVGVLMHRYPESFNPRSLPFRQGRVVYMAVKNLTQGDREGAEPPGAGDGQMGGGGHPTVALVPENKSPEATPPPEAQTGGTSDQKPPAGAGEESPPPESKEGTSRHPETKPDQKPPTGPGSRPGPNEGGSPGRAASLEETDGISPPTARPESRLAAAAPDLRTPGSGPSLPPLPFVRLLGGGQAGALFDPESLNIVLEAYPQKYRGHLVEYLKALQTLGEGRKGT